MYVFGGITVSANSKIVRSNELFAFHFPSQTWWRWDESIARTLSLTALNAAAHAETDGAAEVEAEQGETGPTVVEDRSITIIAPERPEAFTDRDTSEDEETDREKRPDLHTFNSTPAPLFAHTAVVFGNLPAQAPNQNKTPFPPSRSAANMIVYGGRNDSRVTSNIHLFSFRTFNWVQIVPGIANTYYDVYGPQGDLATLPDGVGVSSSSISSSSAPLPTPLSATIRSFAGLAGPHSASSQPLPPTPDNPHPFLALTPSARHSHAAVAVASLQSPLSVTCTYESLAFADKKDATPRITPDGTKPEDLGVSVLTSPPLFPSRLYTPLPPPPLTVSARAKAAAVGGWTGIAAVLLAQAFPPIPVWRMYVYGGVNVLKSTESTKPENIKLYHDLWVLEEIPEFSHDFYYKSVLTKQFLAAVASSALAQAPVLPPLYPPGLQTLRTYQANQLLSVLGDVSLSSLQSAAVLPLYTSLILPPHPPSQVSVFGVANPALASSITLTPAAPAYGLWSVVNGRRDTLVALGSTILPPSLHAVGILPIVIQEIVNLLTTPFRLLGAIGDNYLKDGKEVEKSLTPDSSALDLPNLFTPTDAQLAQARVLPHPDDVSSTREINQTALTRARAILQAAVRDSIVKSGSTGSSSSSVTAAASTRVSSLSDFVRATEMLYDGVVQKQLRLQQLNAPTLAAFLKVVLSEFLQPIFSPALVNAFRSAAQTYSPVDALKLLVLPSHLSGQGLPHNPQGLLYPFASAAATSLAAAGSANAASALPTYSTVSSLSAGQFYLLRTVFALLHKVPLHGITGHTSFSALAQEFTPILHAAIALEGDPRKAAELSADWRLNLSTELLIFHYASIFLTPPPPSSSPTGGSTSGSSSSATATPAPTNFYPSIYIGAVEAITDYDSPFTSKKDAPAPLSSPFPASFYADSRFQHIPFPLPTLSYKKGDVAFIYAYNYPTEGFALAEILKKIGIISLRSENNDKHVPSSSKERGFAPSSEKGTGKVSFTIKSAKIYKSHDVVTKDDPYIKVKLGGVEKKTRTLDETQNPVWNETLTFDGVKDAETETAVVTIWDADAATKDDLIGTAEVSLKKLKVGVKEKLKVDLIGPGKKKKEEARAEIEVLLEAGDDAEVAAPIVAERSVADEGSAPSGPAGSDNFRFLFRLHHEQRESHPLSPFSRAFVFPPFLPYVSYATTQTVPLAAGYTLDGSAAAASTSSALAQSVTDAAVSGSAVSDSAANVWFRPFLSLVQVWPDRECTFWFYSRHGYSDDRKRDVKKYTSYDKYVRDKESEAENERQRLADREAALAAERSRELKKEEADADAEVEKKKKAEKDEEDKAEALRLEEEEKERRRRRHNKKDEEESEEDEDREAEGQKIKKKSFFDDDKDTPQEDFQAPSFQNELSEFIAKHPAVVKINRRLNKLDDGAVETNKRTIDNKQEMVVLNKKIEAIDQDLDDMDVENENDRKIWEDKEKERSRQRKRDADDYEEEVRTLNQKLESILEELQKARNDKEQRRLEDERVRQAEREREERHRREAKRQEDEIKRLRAAIVRTQHEKEQKRVEEQRRREVARRKRELQEKRERERQAELQREIARGREMVGIDGTTGTVGSAGGPGGLGGLGPGGVGGAGGAGGVGGSGVGGPEEDESESESEDEIEGESITSGDGEGGDESGSESDSSVSSYSDDEGNGGADDEYGDGAHPGGDRRYAGEMKNDLGDDDDDLTRITGDSFGNDAS